MQDEARDQYASYHSLARKPLIGGIPIIPLVIGCGGMLLTGFLGFAFFGAIGLVFPALIATALFFLRLRCTEDSRATEEMKWEAKGFLARVRCQSNTISYTSIDTNPQRRKHHVSEWFKNHPHD